MRHEDAGLALWVAGDQATRERSIACEHLQAAEAAVAMQARAGRSLRQRAGEAFIALGVRVAGETRPAGRPVPRRRLAGQG